MYTGRIGFYHGGMRHASLPTSGVAGQTLAGQPEAAGSIAARSAAAGPVRWARPTLPPHLFFVVSAVFHYLGPAFAVLLFAHVDVLGVAWLRIASAALVFAVWRRPWRLLFGQPWGRVRDLVALGVVLGAMNSIFYLAIARLPLGTVAAIEFVGPVVLAALGARNARNVVALGLVLAGGAALMDVRLAGEPLGFAFAFANCGLFMLYVVLGHRIARDGGAEGIDRLGAAMLVALLTVMPLGFQEAAPAFADPWLLLAGVGVGLCSSVIPYICDQLAMARLPRATFALLLALLPATAALIGMLVLRQSPTVAEVVGIALIMGAVAIHQDRK
jgi:inner membrane transporter RhtA